MKKLTTILWIVILTGLGFLLYDNLKPAPSQETFTTKKVPTSNQTDLQKEAEKELANANKTYSSLIRDGDKYKENGYYQEAITTYKQALVANPDSVEILHKLGLAYYENNLPAEARLYFQQAKEIKSSTELDILIGKTYLNNREIEEANAYFNALTAENTANANNEEIKYYKTIIKLLYKKYDEAKKDLNALAVDENVSKEIKDKVGLYVTAVKEFEKYKEGKPEFIEALIAKAFIDSGEFGASIPLLYDVIKIKNNYRDAWVMLGYSYLQTGKIEDAISAFKQAETLDPNKPQTLFFLGLAYAVDDKYEDAVDYLKKASKAGFEPKSLIEQKLADIYIIQEEYEKALVSFENLKKEGIVDKNIYTKAIWICIDKLNKPVKALAFAETLLKAEPEESVSYNLRGWAYVAYGDYEKAKDDLVKALKLNPKLDSAYLNLGWMYEKMEMTATAKEYYKKAYGLGNGNSIADTAAIRFNNIMKADITSTYSP